MVEVDPLIAEEVGIESHSDEAVFLIIGDDDFAQGVERFLLEVEALEFAGDLDEVDFAIRTVFQMHRLGDAIVEGVDLKAERRRSLPQP